MDKTEIKMKYEIAKILVDNLNVDSSKALTPLYKYIKQQLTLGGVSQQRELLLAYEQSKCPKTWWMSKNQAECEVDDFIANNCG